MRLTGSFEKVAIICKTVWLFMLKKPKILYFGAATYGNVGDLAITYASEKFLREKSGRKVIMINDSISVMMAGRLRRFITPKDIVVFQGGGNFGDIYPIIEREREQVFSRVHCKQPLMIQMPTSINYEDSDRISFSKIRNIYSYVSIFARESKSYRTGKAMALGRDLALVPDIVCTLIPEVMSQHLQHRPEYSTIIVIRRSDNERQPNNVMEKLIHSYASNSKINVVYTDTVVDVPALSIRTEKSRRQIVDDKISEIAKADVVITDRLHGMILSRVAQVPVIAFDNSTHKIKHTVSDWLSDDEGVLFVDSNESLSVSKVDEWYYDAINTNKSAHFDFEPLTNKIQFRTEVNS